MFTVYVHLKELRESLGMTQEEFGKSIGIAKSTYNNYEKGIREPKSDFWIAVAKKYGVTIDYLMGFSNDPRRTSVDVQEKSLTKNEEVVHKECIKTSDRGAITQFFEMIRNMSEDELQAFLASLEQLSESTKPPLMPIAKVNPSPNVSEQPTEE